MRALPTFGLYLLTCSLSSCPLCIVSSSYHIVPPVSMSSVWCTPMSLLFVPLSSVWCTPMSLLCVPLSSVWFTPMSLRYVPLGWCTARPGKDTVPGSGESLPPSAAAPLHATLHLYSTHSASLRIYIFMPVSVYLSHQSFLTGRDIVLITF